MININNQAQNQIDQVEAQEESRFVVCGKPHQECGHTCQGVSGESCCLPCLDSNCIEDSIRQNKALVPMSAANTELCSICYTCELGEMACVRLSCGHVYHADCLTQLLEHGRSTLRITFGYLDCPSCKAEIQLPGYQALEQMDGAPRQQQLPVIIPIISMLLEAHLTKKRNLTKLAIQAARDEGCDTSGRVVTEGDAYFGNLEGFAIHFCTFYECFKCRKPYFGGMQDCEQAMQSEDKTRKEDLLCRPCAWKEIGLGKNMCTKHGNEFIDFKCMYCCSIGQFICCKGRYYFCNPCHNDIMDGSKHKARTDCKGGAACPLGIPNHPQASDDPGRSAFAIGCSLCRSEKLGLLADRAGASNGVNIEMRDHMIYRFNYGGHDAGREMNIIGADQAEIKAQKARRAAKACDPEGRAEARKLQRMRKHKDPANMPLVSNHKGIDQKQLDAIAKARAIFLARQATLKK